jgi:hypothetical protein
MMMVMIYCNEDVLMLVLEGREGRAIDAMKSKKGSTDDYGSDADVKVSKS